MTLQFYNQRSDMRFTLNVNSGITLGELREKVAQKLQKPIDAFQLHIANEFDDADIFTLEELSVTNLKAIHFTMTDVPIYLFIYFLCCWRN